MNHLRKDEIMSELYDQIISQRGSLEKLVARIPGFSGYIDNKARRTADRMLRDYIAGEISRRIDRFKKIEKSLLEDTGLTYMSKTAAVKAKLQLFHDKLRAEAPGYSGFFDAIKIGPEEMDKLYSFDEALIRYADRFDEVLDKLDQSASEKNDVENALAEVDKAAGEAIDALSLREDVLTNLGKGV